MTNDQDMLMGQIKVHHDFIEDCLQRLSKYQDELDILGHEEIQVTSMLLTCISQQSLFLDKWN